MAVAFATIIPRFQFVHREATCPSRSHICALVLAVRRARKQATIRALRLDSEHPVVASKWPHLHFSSMAIPRFLHCVCLPRPIASPIVGHPNKWNRSGEGPVHLSSRLEAMASSRVAKTKLSSSLGPSTRHGHGKVRNARVQATERSWGREVRPYLAERAPKQVLVEEAMKMARQDGAVLLDVRLEKDFEQVHAEGAVNVPLFRPIEGTGMSSLLKRVIYAVNGVKGSEGNPNFLSSVEKSIQRGQTVLVMCDAGGAYLPTPSFMEGKKSRSLVAVYALLKLGGYENVVHVFGGLREWASRGLPLEGSNTAAWKDKAGALPP